MSLTNTELVLHFENLGADCTMGFVQRLSGAEPMGLLRFAGMPFASLIRALRTRFAGIGERGNVSLTRTGAEYRMVAENFGLRYHTELHEGEITEAELLAIEIRKINFLTGKLLDDLDRQRKIFVYQSRETMPARNLVELLAALARFGAATLLWIAPADDMHEAGSLDVINEQLFVGYVRGLGPGTDIHLPDVQSWLAVFRWAYEYWTAYARANDAEADRQPEPLPEKPTLDASFAAGGSGLPFQGHGWAEPEQTHCWTVGAESGLTLPRVGDGDVFMKLFVWPYVELPSLPSQKLMVFANDTEVGAFQLTCETQLQCVIPASVLQRRDRVAIALRHPESARPCDMIPGHNDERRLGIAVRRISLHAA